MPDTSGSSDGSTCWDFSQRHPQQLLKREIFCYLITFRRPNADGSPAGSTFPATGIPPRANPSSFPLEFPTRRPPPRPEGKAQSPRNRLAAAPAFVLSPLLSPLPSACASPRDPSPVDSRAWPPHPRAGPPKKTPKTKKREHCRNPSAHHLLPESPWAAGHCCK